MDDFYVVGVGELVFVGDLGFVLVAVEEVEFSFWLMLECFEYSSEWRYAYAPCYHYYGMGAGEDVVGEYAIGTLNPCHGVGWQVLESGGGFA